MSLVKPRISIIGAGNLGWHLALALQKAGYLISEVYSRKIKNAALLAKELSDCKATDSLDLSNSVSELFIICITDSAILEVASTLKVHEDAIIIHTSGGTSIDVLEPFKNNGVLYPVQTFTRNRKISFDTIPVCIEASNPFVETTILEVGKNIAKETIHVTSESRQRLHLAAVFANNFTNHLLGVSSIFVKEQKIDFNILKPLVEETFQKAFTIGPFKSQTGPAVRNNFNVINSHLKSIDNPLFKNIYLSITESIIQKNKQ